MKRILPILIALVLLLSCIPFAASASDATCNTTTKAGTDLYGSNINAQNYHPHGNTVKSYLSKQPDGKLLAISMTDNGILDINYYTPDFQLVENKRLYLELPKFGGVYETDEHFYVVTGQNNEEEIDNKEVIRVTQYDKSWNRLTHTFVPSYNTVHPFVAGSCRFAYHDGILVVRTCHEMYASDRDGRNHQANLTFSVDTKKMELIYSMDAVANSNYGYVSHSFNQFISYEGGYLTAVDHGDGYPRAICLMKYSSKSFRAPATIGCQKVDILEIPGSIGDNTTNTSVGALEVTNTGYLVAGNTKINRSYYDIYLAYIDDATDAVTIREFTNSSSVDYSTPHLVKMADNSYLLLWSDLKNEKVYYHEVNAKGEKVGSQHQISGFLSDCAPVLIDGKVMWYTYQNNAVSFYSISADSLAGTKKTVNHGHRYVYEYDSTNHTCYCKDCGKRISTSKHSIYTKFFDKKGNILEKCDPCGYVRSTTKVTYDLIESTKSDGKQSLGIRVASPDKSLKNGTDYFYNIDNKKTTYVNGKPYYAQLTLTFQIPDIMSGFTSYTKTFYRLPNFATVDAIANQAYTGKAVTPTVSVKASGKTLKSGTDYTLKYSNNTKIGTATVTITGKGNYFGSISKTFKIAPSISGAKVSGISTKAYTGKAVTQSPKVVLDGKTLKSGTDYTLKYSNNTKVGTATVAITGIGNYSGSISKTFKILTNIANAKVTGISNKYYTGKAITQSPKVVLNGKTLVRNTDYTLSHKNNTKAGVATITITGKGKYAGTIAKTFKILIKISSAKVSGIKTKTYTGKAITQSIKVVLNGKTLKKNTDYTISYKNNKKVGKATVTIKGKGKYAGSVQKTFIIKTKKVTLTSLTSPAKKKAKVFWKKDSAASGYEIVYSTSSKFSGKKTIKVPATASSRIITGLQSKKTYYVKIRSKKTISGKTYYGDYSAVKKIRVK